MVSSRRQRDKEKTVQDILSAARKLFSAKGLHGTSLRDLEEASGVSKGLILHHFGTKEALYEAVQALLSEEYIAMMDAQRQSSGNFRELVAAAVRSSFMHTKSNHEYRRISLWSYLEGKDRHSELEQRFTKAITNAMRAGQEAGLVREDIDAFLMPFIIKGTIEYWIRQEKLIHALQVEGDGGHAASTDADERLIDALTKLFLKE